MTAAQASRIAAPAAPASTAGLPRDERPPLVIRRVDLINDSTTVQVRYRLLTTNDTTAGNQLDKPNTYQGPFEPAMRATGNREPLR